MFRFTTRDVLWLTVVVGLILGLIVSRRAESKAREETKGLWETLRRREAEATASSLRHNDVQRLVVQSGLITSGGNPTGKVATTVDELREMLLKSDFSAKQIDRDTGVSEVTVKRFLRGDDIGFEAAGRIAKRFLLHLSTSDGPRPRWTMDGGPQR